MSYSISTKIPSNSNRLLGASQKEVYLYEFIDFIANSVLEAAQKRDKDDNTSGKLDLDSLAIVETAKKVANENFMKFTRSFV